MSDPIPVPLGTPAPVPVNLGLTLVQGGGSEWPDTGVITLDPHPEVVSNARSQIVRIKRVGPLVELSFQFQFRDPVAAPLTPLFILPPWALPASFIPEMTLGANVENKAILVTIVSGALPSDPENVTVATGMLNEPVRMVSHISHYFTEEPFPEI